MICMVGMSFCPLCSCLKLLTPSFAGHIRPPIAKLAATWNLTSTPQAPLKHSKTTSSLLQITLPAHMAPVYSPGAWEHAKKWQAVCLCCKPEFCGRRLQKLWCHPDSLSGWRGGSFLQYRGKQQPQYLWSRPFQKASWQCIERLMQLPGNGNAKNAHLLCFLCDSMPQFSSLVRIMFGPCTGFRTALTEVFEQSE
jgi:hypothetical protein